MLCRCRAAAERRWQRVLINSRRRGQIQISNRMYCSADGLDNSSNGQPSITEHNNRRGVHEDNTTMKITTDARTITTMNIITISTRRDAFSGLTLIASQMLLYVLLIQMATGLFIPSDTAPRQDAHQLAHGIRGRAHATELGSDPSLHASSACRARATDSC